MTPERLVYVICYFRVQIIWHEFFLKYIPKCGSSGMGFSVYLPACTSSIYTTATSDSYSIHYLI